MHSFWQRLNAIFFFTLSVLGFLSFLGAGTTYWHVAHPTIDLTVQRVVLRKIYGAGHDQAILSIGIDAESLQMYWFGIIVSRMCSSDPRAADHAVLLTGFGTAKDMFFQEMKYWEVKNSWGGSWGEKGYFRARFGTNTCGIANHGATAVIH